MKISRDKIGVYWLGLIGLSLPTYLVRFEVGAIPTTLLEVNIYIFVLYVIFSYKLELGRKFAQVFREINWTWWLGVGLVLIGATMGMVISPESRAAMGLFKAYFIDPMLVLMGIFVFVKTKKDVEIVAGSLGLVAVTAGVWSILQYFGLCKYSHLGMWKLRDV